MSQAAGAANRICLKRARLAENKFDWPAERAPLCLGSKVDCEIEINCGARARRAC